MIRSLGLYIVFQCICVFSFTQTTDFQNLKVWDYSETREYEIAEVIVSGVQYIQPDVLVNLTGLRKGDKIKVPGDRISRIIEKFWDQGLFSDVKVIAEKVEKGRIYLNIHLVERPRLSRFSFTGLNKIQTQDLMEKLDIRVGMQVTQDMINNTRRIVEQHFIEKGFYNTQVNIRQRPDTTTSRNMVSLVVMVEKNDRVKIDDIVFVGNHEYSDKRLRRVMKNTKKKNWNIFKASKFIKDDFKEDKQKLTTFYRKNGYRDFNILGDSISVQGEKRIMLHIFIEEGSKYFFRDIEWVGNTIYPSELLAEVLGIKKGDVFDQTILEERLQIDEDAVSSLYLDNGYLFFSVDPVEVNIEDDSIDFEMRIYEGKQATVDRVIIRGNTKTNEHVIRREIRTRPGDLFSKSDIIRTVRELAQLGHFDPEQITPNPIPNQSDGTVDLEYSMVERANDQLEISGGWGANMLIGTIGLRFSNFSARNLFNADAWRPIPAGDGQTLSLRAQSNGKYYQSYNFTFVEPWFGGKKPNSLSLSVFHTITSNSRYFGERGDRFLRISGASLGLGRRLNWPDDYFNLYNDISYQRYKLDDWTGYFLFSDGTSNNISFSNIFARKSVDQLIYPRMGSTFSLSLQVTPPYSLFDDRDYSQLPDNERYKWIEYHKWKFMGEWYLTLAGNLVLKSKAEFGYLGYYNPEIGPSPFEGFDLGGDGMRGYNLYGRENISLRGYENGSLTPIVDGKKAGNVFDKLTLELRHPITLNPSATVFVIAFLEAGNAWYDIEQFNPFMNKRAAGIGLRAFLPMFGLLGLDWGYGFDSVEGEPGISGSQFHFTMGQQF